MSERLKYLFARHLSRTITPPEWQELLGLVLEKDLQNDLKELLGQAWNETGDNEDIGEENQQVILNNIFGKQRNIAPVIKLPVLRNTAKRWLIAASVLFLIGFSLYFLLLNPVKQSNPVVKTTPPVKDIAAPRTARAIIMLANGNKIELDSLMAGKIVKDGTLELAKNNNGDIIYSNKNRDAEVSYNTLINPRGSTIASIVLVDGTKVWLNSESSVKYYTSAGKERTVEITGEAYFEVAKDPSRKFTVLAKGVTTEVVGTHFNINSYAEENNVTITLLEGSVKIGKNGATAFLKPGQQASVANRIMVADNTDLGVVMAWKNGLFQFVNADLPAVMNQLARWYDVEVEYDGPVQQRRFVGKIQRDLNLTDVLDALAKNEIKYKIEGKKLVIRN